MHLRLEVVQRYIYPAIQTAAADEVLADFLGFFIQQYHMIAVPVDGPGDVQGNLREEGQQGGNLVTDYLVRW